MINPKHKMAVQLHCGTADITVEYSQSVDFANKLKSVDVIFYVAPVMCINPNFIGVSPLNRVKNKISPSTKSLSSP